MITSTLTLTPPNMESSRIFIIPAFEHQLVQCLLDGFPFLWRIHLSFLVSRDGLYSSASVWLRFSFLTIGWIVESFVADIHGSQRMICDDFD